MVSANVPRQHGRRRDETRLIETARKTKDMFSWMLGSSNKFAQQICTTNLRKPDDLKSCRHNKLEQARSPCRLRLPEPMRLPRQAPPRYRAPISTRTPTMLIMNGPERFFTHPEGP